MTYHSLHTFVRYKPANDAPVEGEVINHDGSLILVWDERIKTMFWLPGKLCIQIEKPEQEQ